MRALLFVSLILWAGPCRAQKVVAVLSADDGVYREAFESFQAVYGSTVTVLPVGRRVILGPETKVVVAFGSKAAYKRYPSGVALVYCMAPGVALGPGTAASPIARVRMVPRAEKLVASIRSLQPKARRLAVLWSSGLADYVAQLKKAGAAEGMEIEAAQLDDASQLPDELRALNGRVDAIWLTPDPALVTPSTFAMLRDFSRSTKVAFYAPTAGLARDGATGALGIGFRAVGRTAAEAVKRVLAGERVYGDLYADHMRMVVSGEEAARLGLSVSSAVVTLDGRFE